MKKRKDKKREKKRHHWLTGRKRKVAGIALAVLVLAVAAGGFAWAQKRAGKQAKKQAAGQTAAVEGPVQKGNLDLTVSASGTTAGTTAYQLYDSQLSQEGLEVENVLAAAGDTVKKGDTLFTVTKESASQARTALQEAVAACQAELSLAKITYEDAVNTAKEEYETNLSLLSTASLDYQDTLDGYQKTVDTQKKQLEQAKKVIKEYPEKISSLQKKKAAEKQKGSKLQKQITSQQKAVQSAQKKAQSLQAAYETAQKEYSDVQTVQKYLEGYRAEGDMAAVHSLKNTVSSQKKEKSSALKKAKKAYQSAQESYEAKEKKLTALTQKKTKSDNRLTAYKEKLSSFQSTLKDAKANLTLYQSKYDTAVSEQAVGKVSAARTYAENMQTYQSASATYQTACKQAKETLDAVKQSYQKAKKQKKALAALLNGQKVCASQAGTLVSIGYEAGDLLTASVPIAGYQDSSVLNIEVSVDQSDIHCIQVGDEVNVSLSSARGQMTGTVSSIETESSSDSVSSVSYTVIVTLDNTQGNLSENDTASVSFQKGTLEDVLYVPVSAVRDEGSRKVVTVKQEDGTTKQTTVSVGEENGQFIVIESGLQEGDTYVVEREA